MKRMRMSMRLPANILPHDAIRALQAQIFDLEKDMPDEGENPKERRRMKQAIKRREKRIEELAK